MKFILNKLNTVNLPKRYYNNKISKHQLLKCNLCSP